MPLFMTLHPWPGGTMDREQVRKLVGGSYEAWREHGFDYHGYMGTPNNGEGWSLLTAPSREALIRMFHEERIPYLYVSEVWKVDAQDIDLEVVAGANSSVL